MCINNVACLCFKLISTFCPHFFSSTFFFFFFFFTNCLTKFGMLYVYIVICKDCFLHISRQVVPTETEKCVFQHTTKSVCLCLCQLWSFAMQCTNAAIEMSIFICKCVYMLTVLGFTFIVDVYMNWMFTWTAHHVCAFESCVMACGFVFTVCKCFHILRNLFLHPLPLPTWKELI